MATLATTLEQALQHHRGGNLPVAERLYRQILEAVPDCADAHHLLGVLAHQCGRHEEAVASIRRAISLKPAESAFWTNLGVAEDAIGHLDEAVADYREALRLQPSAADAHNNLGFALQRQGQLADAAIHCRLALQYRPAFPEAFNNLGNVLLDENKLNEAANCFQDALRLNANYGEAMSNLGNVFARQQRLDDAVRYYRQALELIPQNAGLWNNLGLALERQGHFEQAVVCHQHAIELAPHFADAWNNLGIDFKRQDKLDEAGGAYLKALELKPSFAAARVNVGNVRRDQGRFDEALACYDRAIVDDADFAEAHFNRSLLHLLHGNWDKGWPAYEWRWRTSAFAPLACSQPRWDGSALDGRTILLHAEQGLGDTIQFVRFVSLVKARGGSVILQCQTPLLKLLAGVPGIDLLLPQDAPLPAFDVHAPLLSLPGIFRTTLTSVPTPIPYLHADPALLEHWRHKLEDVKGLKVGIAWQGNAANPADRRRSIPLAYFAPLANVEGVQLISLQKGRGAAQLRAMAERFPINDLGEGLDEESGPFMDTAAIMTNLDLVISSDTAIPHLAGALGVPVWVALPLVPDWRWLLHRDDCPWYPTMSLIRQTPPGHWGDVFNRIAAKIKML